MNRGTLIAVVVAIVVGVAVANGYFGG